MLLQNKGRVLRSNPIAMGDGVNTVVPLDFLGPALKMQAPVIRQLLIHCQPIGDQATAVLLAEDSYKFVKSLRIADTAGDFFGPLPGCQIRVIEQLEAGDKQIDPAEVAVANDQTLGFFLKVHFDTAMAHRGADTAVELTRLTMPGGEIEISFQAPTNWTFNASPGTCHIYAIVHDERVKEAKSRMVWRQVAITASEDHYGIKGSLRAAYVSSDLGVAAGYTSLAGITSISSDTLAMQALDTEILRQEYLAKSKTRASDDEFLAATETALPLVTPSAGQHIGKMQDLDSLHVNLGAIPASGRLVTCVIRDRSAEVAAQWFGFGSPEDYLNALKANAMVQGKGNRASHVKNWDNKIARRLPVRIPVA